VHGEGIEPPICPDTFQHRLEMSILSGFPESCEILDCRGYNLDAIIFAITWQGSGNAPTQKTMLPCSATRTGYVAAFRPGHRTGNKRARSPTPTKRRHERSELCSKRKRSSSAFTRKCPARKSLADDSIQDRILAGDQETRDCFYKPRFLPE
jgi:hypothetical protein